ncbi:oxygen-independent coproporphyrinogen-3 oxidase [Sphingomonas zeicaulis]|uniref:oxygen-independent coproporphyrinogen III oxidase n=1 Tax=Sphingomonas zeicaulis TaxID=1632740 RepID=UPI003D2269E6
MWTYHEDLLARPVPRYTSYPTAVEFHDRIGPADMAGALDAIAPDEAISLYLHVPYCREICWYCGCNTGAANRTARLTAYLDALAGEIDLIAERLGERGRVRRIAFGGGSPDVVPAVTFIALVDKLRASFNCDEPVLSVEIDPRGFDAAFAAALATAGVSRASLGVQTFDPAIQAAIGRVQPTVLVTEAVRMLRDAGVGSINVDLMYGLPGQTDASLSETLETALVLAPERLAVFGYAHVPRMVPRQRRIDAAALPDARARFRQAELAHAMLVDAGYVAVGFDHFARPDDALARAAAAGTLGRNFQGFTEDGAEVLIGMGASAISAFPDRLLQNEKNSGLYRAHIAAGRLPIARGLHRTAAEQREGRAIAAILAHGAADIADIEAPAVARKRLHAFEAAGLVRWRGSRLILADDARPYARTIAASFDRYRQTDAGRFSTAV